MNNTTAATTATTCTSPCTATTSTSIRPEHIYYDQIEEWFRDSIQLGRDYLFDSTLFDQELLHLHEQYGLHYSTLISFVRNMHVSHVKRTSYKIRNSLSKYVGLYTHPTKGLSIIEIAKKANYPPYLLARYIVQEITSFDKKQLNALMKEPKQYLLNTTTTSNNNNEMNENDDDRIRKEKETNHEIMIQRLGKEIQDVINCDPMYGPKHDKERHMIGIEYEIVLQYKLQSLDVPFETEEQLRDKGTSRTPDILLSTPLGIEVPVSSNNDNSTFTEWKVICWIDSKALFGDVNTHRLSVLPQAESYVHRFGPGLILYWFGHAPLHRLGNSQGDISIMGWDIPNEFMLPTGEILKKKS